MASDSKKTFGAKSPLKKNMCITTSSSPSYTRVFNSEFSTDQTMVDDFFKNSSEIQKELFKLSSIFRSPQKKTRIVSTQVRSKRNFSSLVLFSEALRRRLGW